MNEPDLIAKAKQGDDRALALLLQQHYPFVKKYMLKVTLDPALADELTQETMLRSIERLQTYRNRSKFSSWLITIANRLYIDHFRRMRREQRWLETERAARRIEWHVRRGGGDGPELMQALGRLPPEQRVAVVMKHYYGYSLKEIAAMTEVPEGTVKSRIHLAIAALRKEWTADEW